MDIDEALKEAGIWGKYQILLYALITSASAPNAFPVLQYVFAHYEPSHHCMFSDAILNLTKNQSETFLDFALPKEADNAGNWTRSNCLMYKRNYSDYAIEDWSKYFNDSDEQIACNNGWTFELEPNQKSAVTEFSLVCEDDWKPSMVLTVFLAGMSAGAILSAVADRIGRRPVFLGSSIMQVLSMVFASFSWNFTSYLLASFLCGASTLLNYVAAFVLATEMTAVKWRNFFAMGAMYSFSIGYCLVAFLAYFFQDWRTLMLLLAGLSAVIYAPNLWLFPESVRWLLQKKRCKEALKELKRIAKINGNKDHFESLLEKKGSKIVSKGVAHTGIKETLRILFRSEIAARNIAVIFAWFVCSLVYYGITLYSTSFSDNRFLNVFFAGLAELPSLFAGFYMVKFIGRPRTLSLLMMICALSNLVLPFVPKGWYRFKYRYRYRQVSAILSIGGIGIGIGSSLGIGIGKKHGIGTSLVDASAARTALSMVGKGAVSAAYYVAYLVGSEIAPTLQRGACMAACSICAKIASLISPFLMYTRKIHPFIPNGVMGAIGFACAATVIFCVPETRDVRMPDTEEEAKSNKRIYGLNIFQKFAADEAKISEKDEKESDQEAVLL